MEEIYKLIKHSNYRGYDLNYYLSNYGNIKFESYFGTEQLSLGHGLYCGSSEVPEICIVGVCCRVHRKVYELFKGDIPKGYQIHHLDYNHCNNNVDNLVCCTPKEHGKYHAFSFVYSNIRLGYNVSRQLTDIESDQLKQFNYVSNNVYPELIKHYYNKDTIISEWRQHIKDIHKKIDNIISNKHLQKRIDKQIQRDKEIAEQLASGKLYYDSDGKLHKKRSGWTAERREKTMKTRNETCYHNREWKQKISKTLKQYHKDNPNVGKEISKKLKEWFDIPENKRKYMQYRHDM